MGICHPRVIPPCLCPEEGLPRGYSSLFYAQKRTSPRSVSCCFMPRRGPPLGFIACFMPRRGPPMGVFSTVLCPEEGLPEGFFHCFMPRRGPPRGGSLLFYAQKRASLRYTGGDTPPCTASRTTQGIPSLRVYSLFTHLKAGL